MVSSQGHAYRDLLCLTHGVGPAGYALPSPSSRSVFFPFLSPAVLVWLGYEATEFTQFVLPRKAVNSSQLSLYVYHDIVSIFHIVKIV